MHPHADAQRRRGECRLRGAGSLGRLAGVGERDEERIPRRIDLYAAMVTPRLAQQPMVLRQQFAVPVALLADEPRGALDVGEEEGDRSTGEPALHGLTLRRRARTRQVGVPGDRTPGPAFA